jgi:hypothetical protein
MMVLPKRTQSLPNAGASGACLGELIVQGLAAVKHEGRGARRGHGYDCRRERM